MRMRFDPMIPIWAQVVEQLQLDMVTGRLQPGSKMPSGRDLAVRFTINPNTAARVYQEMESLGLCEPRRGLGTFVTEDAGRIEALRRQMAEDALNRFLVSLAGLGMTPADAVAMLREHEQDAQ